jgi:hypothetical protein
MKLDLIFEFVSVGSTWVFQSNLELLFGCKEMVFVELCFEKLLQLGRFGFDFFLCSRLFCGGMFFDTFPTSQYFRCIIILNGF